MNLKNYFLIFLSVLICQCTNYEDQAKEFVQHSSQELKVKTDQILACHQSVKNIPTLAGDFLPETMDSFVIHSRLSKNNSHANAVFLDQYFLEAVAEDFDAKYKLANKGVSLAGYYNQLFDHIINYQNGIVPKDSKYKYENALIAVKDRLNEFLKWQYVIVIRPIREFVGAQASSTTFMGGSYKGQAVICRLNDAKHLGHVTFEATNKKDQIQIYSKKNESPSIKRGKVRSKLRSDIVSEASSALRKKLKRFY